MHPLIATGLLFTLRLTFSGFSLLSFSALEVELT